MNFEKRLNPNALSQKFEKSTLSKNLKEFFEILFTSWEERNVDSIISNVNVETINEAELFFTELYVSIYELSSKSATHLKADSVILAVNTLDTLLPEILIEKSTDPELTLQIYDEIKRKSFHECFKRIKICCGLYFETHSISILNEIKNVCLVLGRLSGMRYYNIFVYEFTLVLWDLFMTYRYIQDIADVLLFTLSNIVDKLISFLLINIDFPINVKQGQLFIDILKTLKDDLINGLFQSEEISYVLNILDRHNRLIGQYMDAVPENTLYNGFILLSSQTGTLESDDVYEDFEKFLLNEYD